MATLNEVVRVFISSKQSEFKKERSEIAHLVSGMPLLAPVLAEEWSPARAEVRETFLADVRRSPIYVGLFGCVYSAATELEYRTALENPYREILVYLRRCTRADQELLPLLNSWTTECTHTVKIFENWDDLRPHFEKHLWDAVRRMIEAYLQLSAPQPRAHAPGSVMEAKWREGLRQIVALGLPGDLSAPSVQSWVERLSGAYGSRRGCAGSGDLPVMHTDFADGWRPKDRAPFGDELQIEQARSRGSDGGYSPLVGLFQASSL